MQILEDLAAPDLKVDKTRPAPLEQELPLGNLLKIIIVRTYPFGHVPIVGHAPRGILGHSALAVLVPIGHTLVRPDHSTGCSIDFVPPGG